MDKIATIIKKNFKLMLRSKASAVIMLLGPVFLMFIIGIALNDGGEERVSIGYLETEKNNLTEEFVSEIHTDEFSITELKNIQECSELIGSGDLHICIIFPENFSIEDGKTNKIDFIVDNSKINMFRTVVNSMENRLNNKAMELTTGMTQELLDRLNQTTEEISNKSEIVTELIRENTEINQLLQRTENEISSMDLSFDTGELELHEMDSFEDSIIDIREMAEDAIDEADDLIRDIEDFISEGNLSTSDEEELNTLVNKSKEEIKELEEDLKDESRKSINDFRNLMFNLRENLGEIEDKFESAEIRKADSLDLIDEIKLKTTKSRIKIENVEETFNAIVMNIESTRVRDVDSIVQPIKKNVQLLHAEESQLNFYFPYLIILITMFVGTLLASNLVIMEKSSKAYFRNFVTPTKDSSFLLSTYLTTLIMIIIQLTFVFLVFTFYFNQDIYENFALTAFVLFLASTIFTFAGMLIGNIFNSNESNMLAAISISSIMLFVSDLIYPLERMPETIANLAQIYNPFYVASDLLRKTMIHKVDFYSIQEELTIIILTALLLLILVWLTHKIMKQIFILHFAGYMARKNLKKQTRKENEQKIYNNIKSIKEPFVTIENKNLKNLPDIISFLKNLSKKEFKNYVNENKNLFAEWASKNIGDDELVSKLYRTKSKARTISLLKREEKFFQKQKKKESKKSS